MRKIQMTSLLMLIPLALVIAVIPFITSSDYVLRIAALVWIMSLRAIGLNILMGLVGQISLGRAGFFGIGAYVMAILPARYGIPPLIAALLGMMLSALIAFIVGKPILRLKGHYLAIATMGFSLLIALFITNEVAITGGPDGISVPRLVVAGESIVSPKAWYWIAGGLLLVGMALSILLRS